MMIEQDSWLAIVIADLRAYSADLLEVGLAGKTAGGTLETSGSFMRAVLAAIDIFAVSVPRLLEDISEEIGLGVAELVPSPTPKHARPSRAPSDYVMRDGRLIPTKWLRVEHAPTIPVEPLRWLLGIAEVLKDQLGQHAARLEKQVEAARYVRTGVTTYAVADMQALDAMLRQILHARRQLDDAIARIFRRAGRTLAPTENVPRNLPRSVVWQRFRQQAYFFQNPREMLGILLGHLLSGEADAVDPSFLYQRWCGLQVVKSAERLGWSAAGDIIGALFLGGVIQLGKDGALVEMWVEPRLSAGLAPRLGWRSDAGAEVTPDFLFAFGDPGKRDCFVLDVTLATSDEGLAIKGSYRTRIQGEDVRYIAGVPVARRPLRSWAAAPIQSSHCRLSDPEGVTGVIPMDATRQNFKGLDAWMMDLFASAN